MKTLRCEFMGRWGNQLFTYAHARAIAQRDNLQLRCHFWPGKWLFPACFNDPEPDGTEDVVVKGYHQHQRDLIYTRRDVLTWFELDPDIKNSLARFESRHQIVAHHRVGDYGNLGYPVISMASIQRCLDGIKQSPCWAFDSSIVSEENPSTHRLFPDWASFFPDFYRLMTAAVVVRANSTFSWWAATLNREITLVLSPRIDGLPGGPTLPHADVDFVLGNHPKISEMGDTSDLHLRPC